MAKKTKTIDVAIIMGSDSDWSTMEHAAAQLDEFGIAYEVRVMSAHRTPIAATEYASKAQQRGTKVLICAAGGAAHLAGVVAGHSILPVIGVPMKGWALDGLDSLLSTVQMPSGVPVATTAIGKAGAINAAILAVQIMAGSRPALIKKLKAHKRAMQRKVEKADKNLQDRLS